jgi:large subunit ribosomal protein L18
MTIEKRKIRTILQIRKHNKHKRPILNVFRSNKNITAQVVALDGKVLVVSTSSAKVHETQLQQKKGLEVAEFIGEDIAKKCIEKGIQDVVFNKGPYLFGGRVKALADGARKIGLKF